MKIFKFGGASVKDAEGVKNVIEVLRKVAAENLILVVSAMGKTTNALESVVEYYLRKDERLSAAINTIKDFHFEILEGLFVDKQHIVYQKIQTLFEDLELLLQRNKSTNYDYLYDQIVGYGELISTTIISSYMHDQGYENQWLDARDVIKTNSVYREATVDWDITKQQISQVVDNKGMYVTQGFIASDTNNFSTTLGREGSDYSAAIFAYCINAESVSIWKDVSGVLNGDPKVFENTVLLSQISYEEAIELAFYGASVIHPKTLQPLQQKEIPLYVKSFMDPEAKGTSVSKGHALIPHTPCYIVKKNQILLSLSSLDFSFIVEDTISEVFNLLHKYQLKVDLIQNSAISFSVCLDNKFTNFELLLKDLKAKFKVMYNTNVSLYTIRHYNDDAIRLLEQNKSILLKQSTRETYQIVVKQ